MGFKTALEQEQHLLVLAAPQDPNVSSCLCFSSSTHSIYANLFECTLHIYPLVPGGSWIGQTVPSVATATDVNFLTAQRTEGLGHHEDAIVG